MTLRSVLFGINCYLASMAALFIAFSFELPNPWWAVLTVFITSQPGVAGAIGAKAAYRVMGTLLGLAAALIIIPNLVDAPEFMILGLAAWLAVCLYLSLLDRTPRSYFLMLAGYTAILVGLPLIDNPNNIFDAAVARTEEILIGVVCAATINSLLFPRDAEGVLAGKLNATMADAKKWIVTALEGSASVEERIARRRMAIDVTELAMVGASLGFEPHRLRSGVGLIRALEQRLVALLPLLAAAEDRLATLSRLTPGDARPAQLAAEVRAWVGASSPDQPGCADQLLEACESSRPMVGPDSPWPALVGVNLVERLSQLVSAWRDCLELAHLLRHPGLLPSPRLQQLIDERSSRTLHVDHGLAALSALAAGLAVLVCASFAMAVRWPSATIAIGLAAVLTSLFGNMDDPTPIQRRFLVWTLVSIPIAAFYVYAVLPAIDGFGELALVMFPLISLTGMFMTVPEHALRALVCGMVITVLVGLQPVYRADFVAFSDLVVASLFGTVTALVVTMLVRVIQGEVIARRILRAGWADLVQLASGAKSQSTQQFAARMLDRIGLLVPRLAQAKPSEDLHVADALRDLHIGVNLTELIEVGPALPAATQRALLDLRSRLGTYFLGMSQGAVVPPSPLLADIDAVVAILLRLGPSRLRERGVTAAVGLRQNLLSVASPVAIEAVSQ